MKNSIAIVGMGAILPDAMDLSEYWSNILMAKDSIKDISDIYWKIEDFYHPDPSAKDKSYGYKAGEVSEIEFDSMGFGIAPKVMEDISVEQLYALVVARQALLDADMIGKNAKAFNNEKTGVVMAAGIGKSLFSLSRRQDTPKIKTILKNSGIPDEVIERVIERMLDAELDWSENSEPGFLANVTAGRIANRFNLNGTNCAVDAACASSLAALKVAIHELQSGDCDVVLAGGVNLDLTPTSFISFCKTPAISQSNMSRPFDADADGMILGDGVAMVVLKRLEDAKRDQDRIYAVIKSIGSSGDGRGTSIFAPNKEGQLKALNRAYEKTDVTPDMVTLIEAHGTGTHVGDGCELSALTQFFEEHDAQQNTVAIGSVKSQIGHSRLTAGMSGLIKTALALYHRTLPPTINVNKDRSDLLESPFYTLSTPQPWLLNQKHPVRRAGVSSFGFGGTNFHVVLEEYVDKANRKKENSVVWKRSHRLPVGVCLHAENKSELMAICESWIGRISQEISAYDEFLDSQSEAIADDQIRVGFVAENSEDAVEKLDKVIQILKEDHLEKEVILKNEGIYLREAGVLANAKVVTLFSGQGAQYVGMFNELARDYPEMEKFLSLAGMELESQELFPIADILYGEGKKISQADAKEALNDTKYTQPILAAVCGGIYEILKNRGYTEDFLIGHSFGELTGLFAAKGIDEKTFVKLAVARGNLMSQKSDQTGMISIVASVKDCKKWIKDYQNLHIANENSKTQTVVSGDMKQIESLSTMLKELKVVYTILNVSQAFHSPYMLEANRNFSEILETVKFSTLKKQLYNGAEGTLYEQKAASAKNTFSQQIEAPVRFAKCIENAYENGARIFIEIGPGKILTNLIHRILDGKEYYVLAVDELAGAKGAHVQLETLLMRLRVLGMKVRSDQYRKTASEIFKGDKPKSSYLINPMAYMTPAKRQSAVEAIEVLDLQYELVPSGSIESEIPEGEIPKSFALNHENTNLYQMDTNNFNDENEGLEDFYYQEGESYVSKSTILGLQSLSAKALEEFLNSQEYQMEVFKELFKEANGSSATSEVLQFIQTFQNNSFQAFETYMSGQRNVLGSMDKTLEESSVVVKSLSKPLSPNRVNQVKSNTQVTSELNNGQVQKVVKAPSNVHENNMLSPTVTEQISDSAVINATNLENEREVAPTNGVAETDFDPIQIIIKVISDKSGYPEELIDADMNIESDLGIDSIKRIEIFSEVNNQIPGELDKEDVEAISMLHTIQEIGDYIKKKKKLYLKENNG